MAKLFSAIERAEYDTKKRFAFEGLPIPPVTTLKEKLSPESLSSEYEPLKISSRFEETVVMGAQYAKSHVYLENIGKSTILGSTDTDLAPWSVHAQDLSTCKVAIRCDGPIILHNVSDSILILECHQLRIHSMQNCQIFAKVSNDRVIIEGSNNLSFSGFSGTDLTSASFAVDDFDWPTSETENPHYKLSDLRFVDNRDIEQASELLRKWKKQC
ncbi:hypothetical protein OXX79_006226 [Metschnikowia pulcherrima]